MPIPLMLAGVGGALGVTGAGAALAGGLAVAGTGAGAYSAIKGADTARRSANQAADAAKNAGINVSDVAAQANEQALKNARDSIALEKELTPETAALRTEAMKKLLAAQADTPKPYGQETTPGAYEKQVMEKLDPKYRDALTVMFNEKQSLPSFSDYNQSTLSNEANARALEQLRLGGKLDQETANEVARTSAARAGRIGGGALGLGRDLSARDLGLTSLKLANERMDTANKFGTAQDEWVAKRAAALNSYGLDRAQLEVNQRTQRANLGLGLENLNVADRDYATKVYNANRDDYNFNNKLNSQIYNSNRDYYTKYNQQNYDNIYNTAKFAQDIARPVTGLDPGSIADLYVGNSNAKQAAAQNAAAIRAQGATGQMQLGGQMLGSAFSGFMGAAGKAGGAAKVPNVALNPNTPSKIIKSNTISGIGGR